jgi:hypothetical protein
MGIVCCKVPEVPVMVAVSGPAVAVLLAVRVITLLPVVGLGANAAVTPAGKLVAARVTALLKPSMSVTVMVSVVLAPCKNESVEAEAAIVKLGVNATLHAVPLIENDVGTALVTPFQSPSNPNWA